MTDAIIAKRYAEAFLAGAGDSSLQEAAVRELLYVREAVAANAELQVFLSSLEIEQAEKLGFIDTVFTQAVSADTLRFLKFVVERGYIGIIGQIAEWAQTLFRQSQWSEGTIRSAVPLGDSSVALIQKQLEKKMRKKLRLTAEVQPDLIGGIQVVIENIIIDGSVRRKLDELKEKLLSLKAA